MNFGDFKRLDYNDVLPMEMVLSDLLYKHKIGFNSVLVAYTTALERERHLKNARFNEACANLTQILSGNFRKKEDKEQMMKRCIHTLNLNGTFPANIYNEQYHYTDEDKAKWDEFCETMYGKDFNER